MRIVTALSGCFLLLGLVGCATGLQPLAPAPTTSPKPSGWAAEGVRFVDQGRPLFLVDGQYWYWHGGEWRVWRDLGWRSAPPPQALSAMGARRYDGAWMFDAVQTITRDDTP